MQYAHTKLKIFIVETAVIIGTGGVILGGVRYAVKEVSVQVSKGTQLFKVKVNTDQIDTEIKQELDNKDLGNHDEREINNNPTKNVRRRKRLSEKDRKKLEDEQSQSMEDAKGIGKDKREPVHTSVIDPETGKVYHGLNGGIPPNTRIPNALPDHLDPLLQDRINQYNRGIAGAGIPRKIFPDTGVPVNGVPGHHSEIWALNQALKARRAAGLPVNNDALSDLFLSNKRLSGPKTGESIVRCPDCGNITRGVNDVSDSISYRNSK